MDVSDLDRFEHMLESAKAILTFSQGKSRADLDTDRQFLGSVTREFAVIGEAAANVSAETKAKFPLIPWKKIVGMRNRIIHVYFNLNHDMVWNTIENSLPIFLRQLEETIPLLASKV